MKLEWSWKKEREKSEESKGGIELERKKLTRDSKVKEGWNWKEWRKEMRQECKKGKKLEKMKK